MIDNTTPSEDYSAPDNSDKWESLKPLIPALTKQRNDIAEYIRLHEAGDPVNLEDAVKVLSKTRDTVTKAITQAAPVQQNERVDFDQMDLVNDYWNQARKRSQTVTTGLKSLDSVLSGGIETKRLLVVLGAPNTGKTTLVHQMAEHIASSGRPVLYVTSEDSPFALLSKTLARIGNVDYTPVLKGWSSHEREINTALATLIDRKSSRMLRYLDATNGIDMTTIKEKAREHFSRFSVENGGGSGVLVVDYLQRVARAMKSKLNLPSDLREVVTRVAEELRGLATELDCGVIAIASQNRGGYTRASDTGAMASAKESGDIEYTADCLLALTIDKDKGRRVPPDMVGTLLNIDKNRQGQRDRIIALDFWPDRQKFTEAQQ
jgi:replicative DNA helicase